MGLLIFMAYVIYPIHSLMCLLVAFNNPDWDMRILSVLYLIVVIYLEVIIIIIESLKARDR